jgi:hypothetical protein
MGKAEAVLSSVPGTVAKGHAGTPYASVPDVSTDAGGEVGVMDAVHSDLSFSTSVAAVLPMKQKLRLTFSLAEPCTWSFRSQRCCRERTMTTMK